MQQTTIRNKKKENATVGFRLCGLTRGTTLLTPDGQRPVETLSVGDLVSVDLNERSAVQPITWLGRRDVILNGRNPSERLVRIRREAIADGIPSSDLYLAQDHAIYIEGKFYRVSDLVNGGSILFERSWRSVTYWGVQLAQHNVVSANSLLVETLLPAYASVFSSVSTSPPSSAGTAGPSGAEAVLGLEIEIRTAFNAVTGDLEASGVKLDFIIEPHLRARFPRALFQDILAAMLRVGISATVDGRMLLVASKRGSNARMTVTYDSSVTAANKAEPALRRQQEAAALRGASLNVDVSPETVVTLTLSVASD